MYVHFKDFIYLFLERGGEGEREGEKHQCVVAYCVPSTWGLARNPDMGPTLTGNQTSDPLFTGRHSIHRVTPAKAESVFKKDKLCSFSSL